MTRAVWTDGRLDDEHVLARAGEFTGTFGDIAPVAFACVAWRVCTPPVCTPGYVRWHPRITDVLCEPNRWDGTPIVRAEVVAPWPAALDRPHDWTQDRGWRDWPSVFGQYVHPKDRDVAEAPHLRAALIVDAPVPFAELPPAPANPDDGFPAAARRAVDVLAREVNALLAPIVERLEQGRQES